MLEHWDVASRSGLFVDWKWSENMLNQNEPTPGVSGEPSAEENSAAKDGAGS